jgi:hypothetical protein
MRIWKTWTAACAAGALAAALGAVAHAEGPGGPAMEFAMLGDDEMSPPMAFEFGPMPAMGDHDVTFLWAREGVDAQPVKNAPYSADAVTETTQTLADGNRIVRKTTSSVARDGEGRTRREHALPAMGPLLAPGVPAHNVFIHDPVAKTHWMLDTDHKIARRMGPMPPLPPLPPPPPGAPRANRPPAPPRPPMPPPPPDGVDAPEPPDATDAPIVEIERIELPPGAEGQGPAHFERHVTIERHGPGGPDGPWAGQRRPAKTEPLGKRTIEGVEAEGTRSVVTIPAGEMGNERPIEIVSERWYSPHLRTVVMSRHSDPRMGETVFRLTNVVQAEPDRSLFEVPSDYKVEKAKHQPMQDVIIRRGPRPGPPPPPPSE